MTLLLDTHTLLWFLKDDPQLSATAKAAVEDLVQRKLVSIASCWEIAIKAGLGKLTLGEPASVLLPRELARNNFDLLPISLAHATGWKAYRNTTKTRSTGCWSCRPGSRACRWSAPTRSLTPTAWPGSGEQRLFQTGARGPVFGRAAPLAVGVLAA